MTRALVVIALLLSCSCRNCDLAPLDGYCPVGAACFVDAEGTHVGAYALDGVGACKAGHVAACGADNKPTCDGFVAPSPETCNGVDDDCDGFVDMSELPNNPNELLGLDKYPSDPSNTCPHVGVCTRAYQRCEGAAGYVCEYLDGPRPETCNGLDDDCNGVVDDGLDTPEFYYPEDQFPGTVGIGACRPGVRVCTNGVERDTPPVTPKPEICGNGIDDDCNGVVDEGDKPAAVALVVDADMPPDDVAFVSSTVCSFAQDPLVSSTPVAVVLFATTAEPWARTLLPFDTLANACTALSDPTLYTEDNTTENEYPLEGVMIAADDLVWPSNTSHHVLVFGDESLSIFQATQADAIADCAALPFTLDFFVSSSQFYAYDQIAQACSGSTIALESGFATMTDAMRARFADGC